MPPILQGWCYSHRNRDNSLTRPNGRMGQVGMAEVVKPPVCEDNVLGSGGWQIVQATF